MYVVNLAVVIIGICLQCFDAVGWASIRKIIQPVKNWVMRCWHGPYLSGARGRWWFVYGPADATITPLSSLI